MEPTDIQQYLGNHLPNIPELEKVLGWCVAGSDKMPPTPGPRICPIAKAADDHIRCRQSTSRADTHWHGDDDRVDEWEEVSGLERRGMLSIGVARQYVCAPSRHLRSQLACRRIKLHYVGGISGEFEHR